MGKGSSSLSAQQERNSESAIGNTKATGTGAYDKQATFDPRANETINALGGATSGVGTGSDSASSYLESLLKEPNGSNPYAQQVVDTQNKLAQADFDKRLAGVRSSGYGGGIGRDLVDQGMFTGNFTDQQHASNAKTLLDAFNQQQGAQLTGAGQLAGIDATKMASALNLINTLRGEKGNNEQATNTDTSSESIQKKNKYAESISGTGYF